MKTLLFAFFFTVPFSIAQDLKSYSFPREITEDFFLNPVALIQKYKMRDGGIPEEILDFRDQIEFINEENSAFYHELISREDFKILFRDFFIPTKNKINFQRFTILLAVFSLSENISENLKLERERATTLLEETYVSFGRFLESDEYRDLVTNSFYYIEESFEWIFLLSPKTHEYEFITESFLKAYGLNITMLALRGRKLLEEELVRLDIFLSPTPYELKSLFKGELKTLLNLVKKKRDRHEVVGIGYKNKFFERVMFLVGQEITQEESWWNGKDQIEYLLENLEMHVLPDLDIQGGSEVEREITEEIYSHYFNAILHGVLSSGDRRQVILFRAAERLFFKNLPN